MANKIDQVDWMGIFPSLKLVKAGREALQPARMALGLAWVGLLWGGAQGLDALFGGTTVLEFMAHESSGAAGLGGAWNPLSWVSQASDLLLVHPYAFAREYPARAIPALAWLLACTLVAGALVSRLAAVRMATGKSMRIAHMAPFLRARGISVALAPALVLGVLGALFAVLMLCGLVFFSASLTAGVGGVVYGVFWLVAVVAVVAAAAWVLCSILLLPAIAVDGNDGFDAPGRAISYVVSHPWTLALHMAVLLTLAALFIGLAVLVKNCSFQMAFAGLAAGSRDGVFESAWQGDGTFAGQALAGWRHLAQALIYAYAFSFSITGLTRIYFLIRESADGVPETDLWQPTDDQKVTMGVEEEQAHA